MKNHGLNILKLLTAALVLTQFNACAPQTRSGDSLRQAPAPSPSSPVAQGTSDSGGCNGVDNKCFDSYIIDPTTLPAYQKFVKPLLDNLKDEEGKPPHGLEKIFKGRTWYLAPVEFETLKKDSLGVSFVRDNIQQIAIHTRRAIWINKKIYAEMGQKDEKAQGDFLVHEMVMTLYFMQFMSIDEICKINQQIALTTKDGPQQCDDSIPEAIKTAMKPVEWRTLNEEDNENIRFVTDWLLTQAKRPLPSTDFTKILFLKGFDRRFFSTTADQSNSQKQQELKLTRKEFLEILNATQLTGHLPTLCSDFNRTSSLPCKIEFNETTQDFFGYKMPIVQVQVFSESAVGTRKLISRFSILLSEEMVLTPSNVMGDSIYTTLATRLGADYKVGESFDQAMLNFKIRGSGQHQQFLLNSVVVKRGVIASIDPTRDPICRVVEPASHASFDQGFTLHQRQDDKLLTEAFWQGMTYFSPCMKPPVLSHPAGSN